MFDTWPIAGYYRAFKIYKTGLTWKISGFVAYKRSFEINIINITDQNPLTSNKTSFERPIDHTHERMNYLH